MHNKHLTNWSSVSSSSSSLSSVWPPALHPSLSSALLSTPPSPLLCSPPLPLLCSPIYLSSRGSRKLEFYALRMTLVSTVLEATAPEAKLWDVYLVNLQSSGALFPLPHPSLLLCTSLSLLPCIIEHRERLNRTSFLGSNSHLQSSTSTRSQPPKHGCAQQRSSPSAPP